MNPCSRLLFGSLFCFLLVSVVNAQTNCTTTTFINHYRYDSSGFGDFSSLAPDSSFLLGGRINGKMALYRVRKNGDTVWSKKLVFPPWTDNQYPEIRSLCVAEPNNTWLMGFRNNVFTSIDSSGSILFSKTIHWGGDTLRVSRMVRGPDGDKIILFSVGTLDESVIIARVSTDLSTVKWAKRFQPQDWWFRIAIRQIAIKGDKIACIGYHQVYTRYAMILGLNYNTGQPENYKSYKEAEEISLFDVQPYDSGWVVHGAISGAGNNSFAIIKLDTAFNLRSAHRFTNIDRLNSVVMKMLPDGSFYYLNISGGGATYLLHVNTSNVIDASLVLHLFYLTGPPNAIDIFPGQQYVYYTLAGPTLNIGINQNATYIGIYRAYLNAFIGPCTMPTSTIGFQPFNCSPEFNLNPRVTDVPLYWANYSSITTDTLKGKRIDPQCSAVSVCNNIKIIGDTTTCSNQLTLTGRKNLQCKLPVAFSLVQGNTVSQLRTNDTTATFSFVQPGVYKIAASLQGACNYIADTIAITVSQPASLKLGSDTAICKGDSLLLSAGTGFDNFIWQDGTTTSGYVVKQPGTYYVQATATCGGIFRDTIIVTEKPVLPVTVGPDRVKCNADTLHVTASPGFSNYYWYPTYNLNTVNGGSVIANPLTDTAYIVKAANNNGCFSFDTVNVHVKLSRSIHLGNDTAFCAGTTVMLDAGAGYSEYAWNNNVTLQSIQVGSTGTYMVKAKDTSSCWSYDTITITVNALPVVQLNKTAFLCKGTSRTFDGGNFVSHTWQDGSTNRLFVATDAGMYWVKVVDINGCINSDTVIIKDVIIPPAYFLPADTVLCPGYSFNLTAKANFNSFSWNNGSTSSFIAVTDTGVYILTVKDSKGCTGRDTTRVRLNTQCPEAIYFPTAFTPNGDRRNDLFMPACWGILEQYKLKVFNRFGQVIFETADKTHGWNGTVQGIPQAPGAYVWQAQFRFKNEPVRVEKGTVILLR